MNNDCTVSPISSRVCERGTEGCTIKHGRPAVFVSTGGKSVDEIVRDVADAMRKAGLLKETPHKSR